VQHDIAKAGDAELQKYCEHTLDDDITEDGMRDAMLKGIKDKTEKLKVKLRKMTAVANPLYGDKFLHEVFTFYFFHCCIYLINVQS
jgi:hypothetical protein